MIRLTATVFLVQLVHVSFSQDFGPCAAILCGPGSQCDPLIPGCVPVTCEAPDACKEDQTCVPAKFVCVREPCAQFFCGDKLKCGRGLRCPAAYACDDFTNECVPISCDAPDACSKDEKCVPTPIECVKEPCPQYVCEPEGCLTTCGKPVALGTSFQDDGTNFCNTCLCTEDGLVLCTLIACDPNDEQAKCEEDKQCFTECGEPVAPGTHFQDDGKNFCNSCFCSEDGTKICTEIACDPDAEEAQCKECVFCPQVVPQCEPGCNNCEITPQTCEACAFATCLD